MKEKMAKIKKRIQEQGYRKTFLWLWDRFRLQFIYKKRNKKAHYLDLPVSKEEREVCIMKESKNVFIFATVPFYDIGGGQRSAQLAKIFDGLGYRVRYIFAYPSVDKVDKNIEIPCITHTFYKEYPIDLFQSMVSENDFVLFEAPCKIFDPYLEIAHSKKAYIIYENIDNWETTLGNTVYDEITLKNMLKKATICSATAQLLVEQLEHYFKKYRIKPKPIHYIPNAVDDTLFHPLKKYDMPKDFVRGKRTMIYYGSLWGGWFDWSLLFDVANAYPNDTILLIGNCHGIEDILKKAPSNIYFLGAKNQNELPSYLYYSDYALLPFKVDEIGAYVSPLKIFEYIAMNKKILSTKLPDIIHYPNVLCADTSQEWIEYLKQDHEVDIPKAYEFTLQNNWHARVSQLLDPISNCAQEFYQNISIIVLNYNNKNVITRAVDTLLKFQKRYQYEIIVVDNQSKDGSYELLQEYKNIKLIRNSKNGCSSGRNLGVANASGKYILFLDSDQWITNPYWLDCYLDLIQKEEVGAIAWNGGWFNKTGYTYAIVDSFPYRYLKPNAMATKDIGYLATCGFLMKKELFDAIQGFDEAYDPTCYEDSDLSLKIRHAGFEIYYCKYLGVGHLPHQTTKSGTSSHDTLIYQKGTYFVKKWKKIDPNLLKHTK